MSVSMFIYFRKVPSRQRQARSQDVESKFPVCLEFPAGHLWAAGAQQEERQQCLQSLQDATQLSNAQTKARLATQTSAPFFIWSKWFSPHNKILLFSLLQQDCLTDPTRDRKAYWTPEITTHTPHSIPGSQQQHCLLQTDHIKRKLAHNTAFTALKHKVRCISV